jgi:regulator of protease activity HflC (stomatin/prohibitin superfamily)
MGKMTRVLILALCMAVGLVGCDRANVADVERNPNGGVDISVSVNEQEVNEMVQRALDQQGNPLLRNPQVDLQAGQMVISGEHDSRELNRMVSGSLTVTATSTNNALQVQVTQVSIEGFDLSDERIAEFNQRLSTNLTDRLNRDHDNFSVTAVSITADALSFTINVRRG